MKKTSASFIGYLCYASIVICAPSWAADVATYEITVTNVTPGQPIAAVMATTHRAGISFFHAGGAPSAELASLAEAGNGHPMAEKLRATVGVRDARVATTGIPPGGTSTLTITAYDEKDRFSLGAMLGNTNDAFVALDDVALPRGEGMLTYVAPAYDAGSETNDESCSTVPGPACGGAALSPEDSGEGFVHIHNGIHGNGGLSAAMHDWRNPVATITVKRVD